MASAALDTLAHSAASASVSVSNLNTFDDKTKRYLQIVHEKQQLLDKIRDLQVELNDLKEPLIDQLSQTAQSVQICPSAAEEKVYGGIGALVLKLKNDYETMTRDTLVRLLTEFYKYLLVEENQQEIIALGQGTACWIWNNRKRVPIRLLERTYAVKPPPRQAKRKVAEGPAATAPPKVPRFKPVANMPHTRDDFMAIPSLSRILQTQATLPQTAAENDQVDEDDADNEAA